MTTFKNAKINLIEAIKEFCLAADCANGIEPDNFSFSVAACTVLHSEESTLDFDFDDLIFRIKEFSLDELK